MPLLCCGRECRRRCSGPPRLPASGGPEGRRVLAARPAARIFAQAVGQVERRTAVGECNVCTAFTCASLRQASFSSSGAAQPASRRTARGSRTGSDTMPSAAPSAASQAASTASCTSLTLRGRNPAFAHQREPVAQSDVLQPGPMDHRDAAEDAVEVVGIALRHRQAFAAAFGTADEIQLRRGRGHTRCFISATATSRTFLYEACAKFTQRLVVQRKDLRRLDRACSGGRSRCRR